MAKFCRGIESAECKAGPRGFGGDDGQDILSQGLKITQGKVYADFVAKIMKWAAAASAKVDGTPGSYQAFPAFLERQEREVQAFVRGPAPKDPLAGLTHPLIWSRVGKKLDTKMRLARKGVVVLAKNKGGTMDPAQPS
ncbi:unnamed protein product [Pylaiella littoralis]